MNISMMDVGQMFERRQNIIFLRTDTAVPKHVVQELLTLENVDVVQVLEL